MSRNKRKDDLTGRYYFKQTLFGLVLMVEYRYTVCDFPGDDSPDGTKFRKAKIQDLLSLAIKM